MSYNKGQDLPFFFKQALEDVAKRKELQVRNGCSGTLQCMIWGGSKTLPEGSGETTLKLPAGRVFVFSVPCVR